MLFQYRKPVPDKGKDAPPQKKKRHMIRNSEKSEIRNRRSPEDSGFWTLYCISIY